MRGRALLSSPRRGDLIAVLALLGVVVIYFSPALRDGGVFAPFDLIAHLSPFTASIQGPIHNTLTADVADQMVPWNTLDWRLVHAGQFPLWNGYEALGIPQFLNFESGVLSLPDLVSYAVPLHYAYLVAVAVKLTLAGTGAYVFTRVLGARPAASFLAGVTYMLSGPFSSWLGWSMADVFAYAGWLAAFALLAYRRPDRLRYVVLLAVTVAFFVYGGFPEGNVLLGVGLGIVFLVVVTWQLAARRRIALGGLGRAAAGVLAGGALSAPLWLPGLQVIKAGARAGEAMSGTVPVRAFALGLFPGYYGTVIGKGVWFGPVNYNETVGYVGIVALVLALTGIVVFRRRPIVVAIAVSAIACVVAAYGIGTFHPAQALAKVVGGQTINFGRARTVVAFMVAVLAGLGADAVFSAARPRRDPPEEEPSERRVPDRRRVADAFLGSAVLVAAAAGVLAARGLTDALPPAEHHERVAALVWPLVVCGGTLVVAAVVWAASRGVRLRPPGGLHVWTAVLVLGGQTAYLLGTSAPFNTYSHVLFPQTAATQAFASETGGALVGLDGNNGPQLRQFPDIGYYPDVNVGYEVRQFTAHDPVVPAAYFDWPGSAPSTGANMFVPAITSAAEAREYGIGYILTSAHRPAPAGTVFVGAITACCKLYRVPGASEIAFAGRAPGGSISAVRHPADNSWSAVVDTSAPADVVLHVTALPGWHVTVNGKALAVRPYGSLMEQVEVPAGHDVLAFWYFPGRIVDGLLLAVAGAVGLALWCLAAALARRRRTPRQRPLHRRTVEPAGGVPDPPADRIPVSSAPAEGERSG